MSMSKEKKMAIKYKIIYPLIIAFIAIGIYYIVLYYAGKFYTQSTEPVKITVNEDGTLSVNMEGERDNIYILWETDGGNLKAVKKEEDLSHMNESEDNMGYMVYTHCDDSVVWDGKDAAGYQFETANVRAVIYYTTQGEEKDFIGDESVEMQVSVTVTSDNGKTIKAEKERYYSNPVRPKGAENDSEIYVIKSDADSDTFRYRTYEDIEIDEDTIQVLIWSANREFLGETNLAAGIYPLAKVKTDSEDNEMFYEIIRGTDTITVYRNMTEESSVIEAFLVNSRIYQNESFSADDKDNRAVFSFQ